ncbi:shikimate dehydrogenase [Candidatus Bipolaricaulota bacterium]|nr:shikimate dehydrogenase [Candidatus Bipolaricaulota bacterium]
MVEIDASTKLLGLIGNPVGGSLSPKLHNHLIQQMGMNYCYLAFSVEREDLAAAIEGARALGVNGLNVTIPYKVDVFREMDGVSESAEAISAVNTIVFKEDGELYGDNTDWRGFLKSLEVNGFHPGGKRCLVFGAGGAARAVLYGLVRAGAESVLVANRTASKARELVEELEGSGEDTELNSAGLSRLPSRSKLAEYDLFVNATSVGSGELTRESVWEPGFYSCGDQVFFDLIYNPDPTKFLRTAANRGAKTIGGLDMLILQGLESLRIWTDVEFDRRKALSELREILEVC